MIARQTVRAQPEPDVALLRPLLAEWSSAWNLPDLERSLAIRFSPRLRSSLGRCVPATGEIRLASFLWTASPGLFREALCHEAAHAAVYQRHGRVPRPHGPEWRALMRSAGFAPRIRVPESALPAAQRRALRAAAVWEHRCPVCRASRSARRPVRRWRCAPCRALGLAGSLVITRRGGAKGQGA